MSDLTISIVGSETPVGRDLRERLSQAGLGKHLRLIGAEDQITGILSEQDGELVVLTPVDSERLRESRVIFCTGTPESTRKAQKLLGDKTDVLFIDTTYALEDMPAAVLRAPSVEPEREFRDDAIHVIAHPAAIASALVLTRLHAKHPIEHAVIQIFEPASERGQAGMNELQQQSTGLLSFQTLDKAIFDAQVGFNVLPRYGEDAPQKLEDVEMRIDRHIASLIGSQGVPIPSIRLSQAPVFHGYSLSFWIQLEDRPALSEIGETLASALIEVRDPDLEPPSNVGVVGQSGITVGEITADRAHPRAIWLWAVADNYRLLLDNAIEAAQTHFARGRA